jgi:DNA-binding response OmpR family regulator
MAQHILLVEDEADLRLGLSVRLSASGFSCETACNGREGLEHVAKRRPDLIIVDLLMPVMDGFEMVRRLKATPQMSSIPLLVITALPERSRAPRAEELRGIRILQKPFEARELLVAVRALLATSGSSLPDGSPRDG